MVPLRVWLGFMWLTEGVVKIAEGWFKSPQVVNTVNYLAGNVASAATDAVTAATGAAQGAADAVSAATGAAAGAADAVTAATGAATQAAATVSETVAKLPGIFQWVVDHKPSGYGEALIKAPKFVVWIMNHWIAPIEVPVQIMMVIMEILIGLAFMGGLFTFPMALISIVMTIAIAMTGMADITMMWYFVGAIAILMGAGRTIGLDYYVIPWLKKHWINSKLAGKSYLYYDHTDDE